MLIAATTFGFSDVSAKMVELQKNTPADVQLVSFTVDPATDTPAILKTYGESFHADFDRWHFLTGTPQQMFDVAAGMKVAAKPAEGQDPILHSEKILLIDAAGTVRGLYNSNDDEAMKRLVADSEKLAREAKDARTATASHRGGGGGDS